MKGVLKVFFCAGIIVVLGVSSATAQSQADLKEAAASIKLAERLVNAGNYNDALPIQERTLAIREKALGPEHPDTASAINNLAKIYQAMGNYAKALPLEERTLAIREKALGPEHPDTAEAINNLAQIYQAMGNYAKALPLEERALAIREKVLGPEHPDTITNYGNLAMTRYLSGCDLPLVREALSKVFSARDRLLDRLLLMAEETRLSWQKKDLNYEMIDLLRSEQRTQYILRTKSVVLDSLLEDQKAMQGLGSGSPEVSDLISARLRLGKLAFSTKKEDQDEVALLQSRIDAILSNAAGQRVKIGRVRESATITPDTVATALPPRGLLIEFVQFSDPKEPAGRCYGALLLGRDGESKFLRIDDAAGIDASVQVLRDTIAKGDEKTLADQQKILSEKLWAPVAKNLPDGTKKLFIGADGQLNFLSFAALPAPDGSFLAEHYDIAYVGSGRDLARKVTPSDSKSIALFADPVFDRQATSFGTNALAMRSGEVDAFGKIFLPPLPGTKAEEAAVEEVAKAGGWTPDGRLGEAANKSAIMNLKSPGILHLATHGFYLNTPPSNGADGERGMKVMEASEMQGNKPVQLKIDPMHASGIALSGAQATLKAWSEGRVPNPKDDGILTAEEVGGLNLDGTWLVTLSACETGVGEARSGEGVFGLRRAFMIAGAQNLLMTLWPVSDEVTPKIMTDFYKEALATHDAAGSLAKVQRDWLVKLRKEKGLLAAVRDAGPFAMVVMAKQDRTFSSPSAAIPMDSHDAAANSSIPTQSIASAIISPPADTPHLVPPYSDPTNNISSTGKTIAANLTNTALPNQSISVSVNSTKTLNQKISAINGLVLSFLAGGELKDLSGHGFSGMISDDPSGAHNSAKVICDDVTGYPSMCYFPGRSNFIPFDPNLKNYTSSWVSFPSSGNELSQMTNRTLSCSILIKQPWDVGGATILDNSGDDYSEISGIGLQYNTMRGFGFISGWGGGGCALWNEKKIDLNRWYNVTATYDGKKASIYVDGILNISQDMNMPNQSHKDLSIGRHVQGLRANPPYFTGEMCAYLKNVLIFKRALNADEVSYLHSIEMNHTVP